MEREDEINGYIELQDNIISVKANKIDKLMTNNMATKQIQPKLSQSLFTQSVDMTKSSKNEFNKTVSVGIHKPKSILKKLKPEKDKDDFDKSLDRIGHLIKRFRSGPTAHVEESYYKSFNQNYTNMRHNAKNEE
jgi:hypothetical protein